MPKLLFLNFVFVTLILLLTECKKDKEGQNSATNTVTVTTKVITEITDNSAKSGGIVSVSGSTSVGTCGVCWSEHPSPTISDNYTTDKIGAGEYTSVLQNLTTNTKYYVRAYATINTNSVMYGNEKSFTASLNGGGTPTDLPTVSTAEVTDITSNSARCGGNVTNEGVTSVTARGICWSTSPNPTLDNTSVSGGMGTGSFISQLSNLEIATTYYVRAYATNSAGTAYGNAVSFTTKGSKPQGAIDGLFSVSENKQVYFSQGNLQYQASTHTWRFAEHQWDWIGGYYYYDPNDPHGPYLAEGTVTGSINNNISPTYTGWIDLFGWGTSGHNHGAICYQPWSTSENHEDYYAYGSANNNLYNFSGEADWGYNNISNGGNQTNLWRTLTSSEWEYVLYQRNTPTRILFAKAIVNNQKGIIILPDNWNSSYYSLNNINSSEGDYSLNSISETVWTTILQAHGAVFLPNNLCRSGTNLPVSPYDTPDMTYYWTSSNYDGSYAYAIWLTSIWRDVKCMGLSVRLVCDF